eukprot:3749829-Rhodomonas_salina.1
MSDTWLVRATPPVASELITAVSLRRRPAGFPSSSFSSSSDVRSGARTMKKHEVLTASQAVSCSHHPYDEDRQTS